jgi:uncharacterized repeat protein (TIGR01451 family)
LGPFEHVILNLVDSVALSTELGDPLSVEGTLINPGDECSEENNQLSFTDIVVGSIDPNDKLVFVDDKGILSTATINDTIVYKIRFQNLGNYAARRVVIVDTLSPDLDWESLQNSTSSHDFSFSKQGNILYWVAENIELPDSASDPEGSMGYVSFTVRSKRQIAPYTTINNVASIQFDYNEHIVTNTAKIQIVPFGNENNSNLFVYPNPTESDFNVCLLGDDGELQKLEELILFDANGNQLKQLQFSPIDRVTVDVTNLSPGLYIAEGVDSSKEKYRAKIIVR